MTSPDETERTTDSPLTGGRPPASREELQAAVEEKTAAAEAAGAEPIVNAAPARERTAAQEDSAMRGPQKEATQGEVVAEQGGTAAPVVAPAPIAEPGSASGAPAGQPEPPSPDPARPNTPQAPGEDGGTSPDGTTPTETGPAR